MRRLHIADRRSRTSLGTTAPVQAPTSLDAKTSPCEFIGRLRIILRSTSSYSIEIRHGTSLLTTCMSAILSARNTARSTSSHESAEPGILMTP
jgi:hypothetical protein